MYHQRQKQPQKNAAKRSMFRKKDSAARSSLDNNTKQPSFPLLATGRFHLHLILTQQKMC
jgi:hypothetical protein